MGRSKREHLYRTVSVRVWRDVRFRRLSDDAKLLFLRLLTGPETTQVPGVVEAGRLQLAESLSWDPTALDAAWAEIEQAGMAICDWESQLVYLPKALKHRPVEGENQAIGVVSAFRDLADSPIVARVARDLDEYAHTLPAGKTRTILLGHANTQRSGMVIPEGAPTEDQILAEVYPQKPVDNAVDNSDRPNEKQEQEQERNRNRISSAQARVRDERETRSFIAQLCNDLNAVCAEVWAEASAGGDPPSLRFGQDYATVAARAFRRDTATTDDHERALRRREFFEVVRTATYAAASRDGVKRPAAYALASMWRDLDAWDDARRKHAELRGLGRVADRAHAAGLDRQREATVSGTPVADALQGAVAAIAERATEDVSPKAPSADPESRARVTELADEFLQKLAGKGKS